jgi:hypothetical protein
MTTRTMSWSLSECIVGSIYLYCMLHVPFPEQGKVVSHNAVMNKKKGTLIKCIIRHNYLLDDLSAGSFGHGI